MPSTRAFSTAIGVMLAFALEASAGSISFTSAPGPITSLAVNNDVQFSGAFAFPAFDSSWGTLSAVAATYAVSRIDGFLYYSSGLWDGEARGCNIPVVAMRNRLRRTHMRLIAFAAPTTSLEALHFTPPIDGALAATERTPLFHVDALRASLTAFRVQNAPNPRPSS